MTSTCSQPGSRERDRQSAAFAAVFAEELQDVAARRAQHTGACTPDEIKDSLCGLALSGGGVRSATFALGVVQALLTHGAFHKVDYLSTVSGGGYLGAFVSSWYRNTRVDLPIVNRLGEKESEEIRRLRDYASYLAPKGKPRALTFAALVALGFSINLILIIPLIIVVAVLFGLLLRLMPFIQYPLTHTILGFAAWATLYALFVSTWQATHRQIVSRQVALVVTQIIFLGAGVFLFLQLQAPAVDLIHSFGADTAARVYATVAGSLGILGIILAGMRGLFEKFAGIFSQFWRIALSLVAPLLIWYIILLIEITVVYPCSWLRIQDRLPYDVLAFIRKLSGVRENTEVLYTCTALQPYPMFQHDELRIGFIYLVFALLLALLSLLINVNATSLHTFYRDRLAEAYIFSNDGETRQSLLRRWWNRLIGNRDSETRRKTGSVALSSLSALAPYHLINAAINIQSSRMNMRGRNADVFTFSRRHAGSNATDYCSIKSLERADRQLDLATVIAISGAAFGPNQGRSTNRPLRFLMAIANARLGYWLANPAYVARGRNVSRKVSTYFFFRELFGRLNERRKRVNISDGGHIENLGVYELLRRRCRYIIICDAECDPTTTFPGLAHVTRLARIDFGYQFELNLIDVRQIDGFSRSHCAVGRVRYSDTETGSILYIKPTLTGDEAEYLYEYRTRNAFFPHESTSDQFFTEEQFEAYRALGEHITNGLFTHGFREWESWFAGLERKLLSRPMEDDNYFAIQAAITGLQAGMPIQAMGKVEKSPLPIEMEIYVRKQLEIIETAFIRLKLHDKDLADGPYRNLIAIFSGWASDGSFRLIWPKLSTQFGADARGFVDDLLTRDELSGPSRPAMQAAPSVGQL